ncbi:MAG TPA: SHOCT domain-containing protein [Crenalkalicoccus sp.]|jgi:hypothetical protein|nr:SHOCT domain-containing protein [Crenalkalicoccus sp.]
MHHPEAPDLTADGRKRLAELAQRHGVSLDAALTLLRALAAGGGSMAQFSHPELGGLGQWATGGMVMVGDMFNQGLRQRVDGLGRDVVALLQEGSPFAAVGLEASDSGESRTQGIRPGAVWWPTELGAPAATGGQNAMRYAYFPVARRLAIHHDGTLSLYDTGEHRITGVSQQQSAGGGTIALSSDAGPLRLDTLRRVDPGPAPDPRSVATAARAQETSSASAGSPPPSQAREDGDPLALIERLAELHRRGVLTEEEFTTKKAELLRRI